MTKRESEMAELLRTEIRFLEQQCGWLFAFGAGMGDSAPEAGWQLRLHAQVLVDEAMACERRLERILGND